MTYFSKQDRLYIRYLLAAMAIEEAYEEAFRPHTYTKEEILRLLKKHGIKVRRI